MGRRLPRPQMAPLSVFMIMQACWSAERPSFRELLERLNNEESSPSLEFEAVPVAGINVPGYTFLQVKQRDSNLTLRDSQLHVSSLMTRVAPLSRSEAVLKEETSV